MSVTDTSMKGFSRVAPVRHSRSENGVASLSYDDSFLRALAEFLHDFQRTIFDTYHPERHYMRGPGPACAAKGRIARSPR